MEPDKQNQGASSFSSLSLDRDALNAPMQLGGQTAAQTVPAVGQGLLLDDPAFNGSPRQALTQPRKGIRRRVLAVGLVGVGLIAALLVGWRITLTKNNTPTTTTQKIKSQSVPLQDLTGQLSAAPSPLSMLTVNGQLAVKNAITLLPMTKPANAVAGELYYDQTTNQLGYYNGAGFIYLQGGVNSSVVNNFTTTSSTTNVTNTTGGGGIGGSGTVGALALFGSANTIGSSIVSQNGSTVAVKGGSNTTAAFQVQNAAGNGLLTADTANNTIVLGSDGAVGTVTVRGGQAVGSNLSGASLIFQGTNGTGSANGGDIVFQTGQTPQGGIQLDTTATTAQNSSTVSMSYTTSTQRSRLLMATTDWAPTNFTYNGRPLTLLGSVSSGRHFGGGVDLYLWYLVNPPSGTFTLSADNAGTGSVIGVSSYYNVNQSTPFGTLVSAQSNISGAGSSSLAVTTSSASQIVVDAFGVDVASGTCTPASGQMLRWSIMQQFFPITCGSDIAATGGNMSLQWSVNNADWADIAVPINPAVPGSAPLQSPTPTTPDTMYDRLHITATGNVGVNTANPQYTLDVNGMVNASTSVYSPVFDTASPTVLSIGNLNASGIQIGNTTSNISTAILGTTIIQPTPNNDSTTAFQLQNASSVTLFNADTTNMAITISGASGKFATLTLSDAHVNVTQTATPTISSPLNCGAGATASVTAGSTDITGSYTIHAGTGAPTTCDVTLSFSETYGAAPNVILTPSAVGGAAGPLGAWVSGSLATSFTAQIAPTNASASATYSYYYWVAQ